MYKKIIIITGGQRSGKSTYAQRRALQLSHNPVYLATSRIWDAEFGERVKRHQQQRSAQWTNIEEDKQISKLSVSQRVVVIDCLTLWATNFFYDNKTDVEKSLVEMKQEFDKFTAQESIFIFVTNEIGLGGVAENAIQRRFTDLLGWLNQYVATKADEVILMVAGIPLKIK